LNSLQCENLRFRYQGNNNFHIKDFDRIGMALTTFLSRQVGRPYFFFSFRLVVVWFFFLLLLADMKASH
jgi:hypothetical protein